MNHQASKSLFIVLSLSVCALTGCSSSQTITTNSQWSPQIKNFGGVDMVLVPAGCFMMGSTDKQISDLVANQNEGPQTKICFDQQFWIDKYPVWQAQFKQFNGKASNLPQFTGDMLPVDQITWSEANNYCINNRSGRLPTEAEWEYAARGPDDLIFPWGNTFDDKKAVYLYNSNSQPAPVNRTSFIATSWVGALDMSGNIFQWTSSVYLPYPYLATGLQESKTDTKSDRVLRGGSWGSSEDYVRSASRVNSSPSTINYYFGFRCARNADKSA